MDERAIWILKPGGWLVSLCPVRNRQLLADRAIMAYGKAFHVNILKKVPLQEVS
jgi:hypothetical protein